MAFGCRKAHLVCCLSSHGVIESACEQESVEGKTAIEAAQHTLTHTHTLFRPEENHFTKPQGMHLSFPARQIFSFLKKIHNVLHCSQAT